MKLSHRIIAFVFFLLASGCASVVHEHTRLPAATTRWQLFINETPVENYDEIVKQIRPGDELVMSDGKIFTLGQRLDGERGRAAFIYEIVGEPNRILRFPKKLSTFIFLDVAFDNYSNNLRKMNLPAVRLHMKDSRRGQYIIAERVTPLFTLNDLLKNEQFPKRAAALEAFPAFMSRFSDITQLGDFNATQIAYTQERGWMLLDWSDAFQLWKGNKDTILEQIGIAWVMESLEVPPPLWDDLYEKSVRLTNLRRAHTIPFGEAGACPGLLKLFLMR